MSIRTNFLALFALSLPISEPLYAEMYKCPGPNGAINFTDKPCQNGYKNTGDSWISVEEQAKAERERLLKERMDQEEMIRNLKEQARQAEEQAKLKAQEANIITFSGEKQLSVPSDPKATFFILEKGGKGAERTIVTKRVGPSGTTYSRRLYNCTNNTVKYLGSGETMSAMNSSKADPSMAPIVQGAIAYYVGLEACR
jgi:hypothetical protein